MVALIVPIVQKKSQIVQMILAWATLASAIRTIWAILTIVCDCVFISSK